MTFWYPPTYYNHFLEHPILWNQDRRRWEEQRLAHECYSVWKAQERLKRTEKLRNQSEVWKPQVACWKEETKKKENTFWSQFLRWSIPHHIQNHLHNSTVQSSPRIVYHQARVRRYLTINILSLKDTKQKLRSSRHFYCGFPTLCKFFPTQNRFRQQTFPQCVPHKILETRRRLLLNSSVTFSHWFSLDLFLIQERRKINSNEIDTSSKQKALLFIFDSAAHWFYPWRFMKLSFLHQKTFIMFLDCDLCTHWKRIMDLLKEEVWGEIYWLCHLMGKRKGLLLSEYCREIFWSLSQFQGQLI